MIELLFAFALSTTDYEWHCLDRKTCPIPTVEVMLDAHRDGSFSYLKPLVVEIDISVDLKTPEGQSIVVHEFVHYLQWRAGKYTPASSCSDILALEREAYAVGAKYLATKGITKDFADQLFAAASMCATDE